MRVVGKRAMSATHKSFRHRSKVKKGVPLTKLQQEKIVELLLDWCEQDILESGKEE